MKGCQDVKYALDTTFEVSELISFSSKRAAKFHELKAELRPIGTGFPVLCSSRWAVMAASLKSILDNYTVLQELREVSKNDSTHPSMKVRIIIVKLNTIAFSFTLVFNIAAT